jgi:S1-C subfamily serine protease
VSERAAPTPNESGIVDIDTKLSYLQTSAAGTGMVLTPSGEVLTNNHVIRGATSIRVVELSSGRSYRARVVGYDLAADVAVLQIRGAVHLPTVTAGDSGALEVGSPVTAVGNAGGVGGAPTVTTGRVLALDQSVPVRDDIGGIEQLHGLLEMNAPLEPGDSGGPLLNAAGAVVGMDTAGASGFAFQPVAPQSYAVPIDTALAIARQIEAGRATEAVHVGATPFIGINVQSPDQAFGAGEGEGALVVGVVPSSPAERAGMSDGDVITLIAGKKITSYSAITAVLLGYAPGATVGIGWVDEAGAAHTARLRLGSGPPQ